MIHEPTVRSDRTIAEHDYWLMPEGRDFTDALLVAEPETFGWYRDRAELIATVAKSTGGSALKARQYKRIEYASTAGMALIPPITDAVQARLDAIGPRSHEFLHRSRRQVRRRHRRARGPGHRRDGHRPPAAAGCTGPAQGDRIAFTGTKTPSGEDPEPFSLDYSFEAGLTAVTSEKNLVGKSTILWLIRWALTGRRPSDLADDVREWIDEATVEGVVGTQSFVVDWTLRDGATHDGSLTTSDGAGSSFMGQAGFEETMGAFMLDRLRLSPTPWWKTQRRRGQRRCGEHVSWPGPTSPRCSSGGD